MTPFACARQLIALLLSLLILGIGPAAYAANSQASTCRAGGIYIMVFAGGMSGNGGANSLQTTLTGLIGTSYGGAEVGWQNVGNDVFEVKQSLENVLGDLAPEDPSLTMAVADVGGFLGGSYASETAARDVALPYLGEFFANTRKSEPGALRVADNAYQQLAAEIRSGKRVLLIAHSDGAFAMQATYDRLVNDFGVSSVGRYSIAPLTSGGTYITASSDQVVAAVRKESGSTAPAANVTATASAVAPFSHNPGYYLGGASGLRSRIKTDILNALAALKAPASTSEGGYVTFSARPNGNYFVDLNVVPPSTGLGLGTADSREIRPGVYEYTSVIPCNTPPAWAGKYTVTTRFGSGAKPGDEAIISVTRPGRGTQSYRVKAPICAECIEYDDSGNRIPVVDTHKDLVVTAVQVDITADGTASTTDKSPAFGNEIAVTKRPGWRDSEAAVGKYYNETKAANPQYLPNQSYKDHAKGGGLGSVRPDWYQDNGTTKPGQAIEVKNYDLKKNRSKLLKKLNEQLSKRKENLPNVPSTALQTVFIELQGQTCSAADVAKLKSDLLAQNPETLKSSAQIQTIGQCL